MLLLINFQKVRNLLSHLIKALSAGFSLWESHESRKYVDKLIRLKKEYYLEIAKDIPDHAVLDNIRYELQFLSTAFYTKVTSKDSLD